MTQPRRKELGNSLSIALCISSEDLTPNEITKSTGIQPTSARLRGAPSLRGESLRQEFDISEWEFRERMDERPGTHIADQSERFITEFLEKLKDAATAIRKLSERQGVLVLLEYRAGEIPYLGLTPQNVEA